MPDAVNCCSRRCHAADFRGSIGRAMSRLLENGLKSVNPRGYQGGQEWLWWALTGQEPKVACRQVPLAVSPWHTLDGHAAGRAINPPHRVDEEHRHVPERDELKPSGGKPVIAGPLLAAARADGPPIGPGLDVHLQERLATRTFDQSLLFIDEGLERLDAIENTLEVHPAVAPGKGLSKQPHLYRMTPQDAFFHHCLPEGRCFQASKRRRMQASAASGGPHQVAKAVIPCPRSPTGDCNSAAGSMPISQMHTREKELPSAHSAAIFTHRFC